MAVLNDATGTLLAGSYIDHTCDIGLIMGKDRHTMLRIIDIN